MEDGELSTSSGGMPTGGRLASENHTFPKGRGDPSRIWQEFRQAGRGGLRITPSLSSRSMQFSTPSWKLHRHTSSFNVSRSSTRELLRFNAFCSGATNHFDRCVYSIDADSPVLEVQGVRPGAAAQIHDPVALREKGIDLAPTARSLERAHRQCCP